MVPNKDGHEQIISDHLVFFIHGMGQQYEKYGNMKHHVSTMQKNTIDILSSQYPSQKIRIKYTPIEWHSDVHQLVDAKMNKSTLNTVPKVRLATNDWLMDCLYYFSKPYGQYIIDSVCNQCNLAYQQHKVEYPDFDGDVHFIGFSLGGIIGYDIASMQWLAEDGNPPWVLNKQEEMACQTPDLIVPKLDFKIRYLFTCGSPIAAGLICRGLDYTHFRPPFRTKIYNIFHPFDPLGYRLEPMVNSNYETVEPIHIHRMKRSSSLPKIPNLGIRSSIAKGKPLLQSFWQYVSSTVIQNSSEALSSASDIKSTECSTSSSNSSSTDDFTDEDDNATLSLKRKEEQDGIDNHQHHKKLKANEQEIQTTTSSLSSLSGTHPDVFTSNQTEEILVTPNDDGHEFISCIQGKDGQMYPRTDYVLSENMIDAYASEWIVALKSHFRYWANRDVTLHIIKVFMNES